MFVINEDMSIYVTRGDIVTFTVTATKDDAAFTFKAGDVVRIKVFEKKACENVVLQKDFGVDTDTNSVEISLSETDTRIGGVISKPTDYWYEIELNPFDDPQTIIGYDEDGAKVFKLFPEGKDLEGEVLPEDIPVVDSELDMTSKRPIENQAVAREFAIVKSDTAKELNKKLDKAGGKVTGNIDMSSKKVTGLSDPTNDGDAVNLGYANKTYAVGKSYISGNTDLNTVTASGMYRLGGSLVNAPSGASYGQLLVVHGGGDSIAQLAFDFTMARMWVRTGAPAEVDGAGTWTEWAQCYTTAKKPTAADVGARPNTWTPSAADVGATPASHETDKNNPHGVTAAQTGAPTMAYAKKVGAPYNILDNSYFKILKEIINQRGQTTYNAVGYGLDRWVTYLNVSVHDGFVRFENAATSPRVLYQHFPLGTLKAGAVYTFAYKRTDGVIKVVTATCNSAASAYTEDGIRLAVSAGTEGGTDMMANNCLVGTSIDMEWCALYEGEYTEETLPDYQPKGYAVEFAECARYAFGVAGLQLISGMITSSGKEFWGSISLPVPMRLTEPSATMPSVVIRDKDGYSPLGTTGVQPTSITITGQRDTNSHILRIRMFFDSVIGANNTPAVAYITNSFVISADL